MNAHPTATPDVRSSTHVDLSPHPYASAETSVLADSLEAQYDRGDKLNPEMVFEVLNRLLDAEGLSVPMSQG